MFLNLTKCLLLAAAIVSLAGCASTRERAPLGVHEEAARVFRREDFTVVWIPSGGKVADAAFLTASSAEPSRRAKELAETFERAKTRDLDVVVSGPNSAKVRRVVVDALNLQVSRLPGLRLLYIGDPAEAEAIRAAVRAQRAVFYYSPIGVGHP